MAWNDRQTRMLGAMGLRVWARPEPAASRAVAAEPETIAAGAAVVEGAPRAVPTTAMPPSLRGQAAVTVTEAVSVTELAQLGWPELRAAVAACRACSLCDSRKQTVFGAGHMQAAWMIVGEAPGAQEDAQGEPFVGPSGQLLDSMLGALGLSRGLDGDPARRVYIANTLKCRPPANRNPLPEEMSRCAPFLERQIELLQPRLILAMGRAAVQALLGEDAPLGQLRGRVYRLAGRPVVVTYHPSYLLRSPGEKAKSWADLCLAASTIETERG